MTTLRFIQSISGPDYTLMAGEIVEWHDDAEAQRFIDAEIAELWSHEQTAQTASAPPSAEQATAPPIKEKKK